MDTATSVEQRNAWFGLHSLFAANPGLLRAFEHMCSDVEDWVRKTYADAGTSPSERSSTERRLLITGQVPHVLFPVARQLLKSTIDRFQSETDMANVYFAKVDWLGLTDYEAAASWKEKHRVDALRKIALSRGTKVRRCTRCAAIVEDLIPRRDRIAQWVWIVQKTCLCGSQWVIAD